MAIHSSNSASLVALLMDSSEDHRTVDGARWVGTSRTNGWLKGDLGGGRIENVYYIRY